MRKKRPRPAQEVLELTLDAVTFKAFLRDLLFREAGKPYFKRLAIPRRHRLLGTWRTLSTYEAERQLLPVGGRDTDKLIARFFTTHARLRAEFQEDGMPVSAIHVLWQHCPCRNAALEHIRMLECAPEASRGYALRLTGGAAPASPAAATEAE